MAYLASILLVAALLAGVLGLTGVAGFSAQLAWVLFAVGSMLAIMSFVLGVALHLRQAVIVIGTRLVSPSAPLRPETCEAKRRGLASRVPVPRSASLASPRSTPA
jgi:uncharacterized membrane protein YtjA (UPF0391 family)